MSKSSKVAAGPIALVGSGEYLPQMEDVDRLLLAHVGGASARVVVLPTAAGLEHPSSPERWAQAGIQHFTRLGAQTEAARILNRDDAFDERWLPLLDRADLIYFSGGSPRHLIDTMSGSPVWEVIRTRHSAGAVLAGCSAGAMAFGRLTLQPRTLWSGGVIRDIWYPALALLPHVVALPHFDRWKLRMSRTKLTEVAATLPADLTLVGIDEDTALVTFGGADWQVMGRQSVSVIEAQRGETRHPSGSRIEMKHVGAAL